MNIILIPHNHGKGHSISLSHGQVWLLAIVLLLALPILLGSLTYQIHRLLDQAALNPDPEYLTQKARLLDRERQTLEDAKRNAEIHLNALTQRLGYLQAQLIRLNALGSRVAHMAGLDKSEFNFNQDPPLGGPEVTTNTPAVGVPDFLQSLDTLSQQIEQKSAKLNALESVMLDRNLQASVTPRGWPVQGGWMSSGFGRRIDPFTGHTAFHEGVDIADHMGSPIHALGAGIVVHAGPKEGYGLMVEINHGNGRSTRYAHASAILVKEGDTVTKGQTIALVGSTGRSTGPHLHFEVLQDGHEVNPLAFLKGP